MSATVKSQVSLPVAVDAYLRNLGDGRLSAGIAFLVMQDRQRTAAAAPTKPSKPMTPAQRNESIREAQARGQAIMALQVYAERDGLTADSPEMVEAVQQYGRGITMADVFGTGTGTDNHRGIVPDAPRAAPVPAGTDLRDRMIATYQRAALTRAIDPRELEPFGITMADILPPPAPEEESVEDLLEGWGE